MWVPKVGDDLTFFLVSFVCSLFALEARCNHFALYNILGHRRSAPKSTYVYGKTRHNWFVVFARVLVLPFEKGLPSEPAPGHWTKEQ